jgi:hypothetical protein
MSARTSSSTLQSTIYIGRFAYSPLSNRQARKRLGSLARIGTGASSILNSKKWSRKRQFLSLHPDFWILHNCDRQTTSRIFTPRLQTPDLSEVIKHDPHYESSPSSMNEKPNWPGGGNGKSVDETSDGKVSWKSQVHQRPYEELIGARTLCDPQNDDAFHLGFIYFTEYPLF